jgi:type I restriction enzyme, S subunit
MGMSKMALVKILTGWDNLPLRELGTYINGRAFKPSDWEREGLPIIRIQNLTNPNAPFNYYSGKVEDKYYVKNGDLLISWSATLGAYIWQGGDAILNQHIFKVEVKTRRVEKLFLKYAVQFAMEELNRETHGSTMRHVTKGTFEDFKIPVPISLDEQRRIITRLEALLAELVSARDLQDKIQEETELLIDAALREVFAESIKWENMSPLENLVEIRASLVDPKLPEYATLPHIYGKSIEEGTGILLEYNTAAEDGMTSSKYLFDSDVVLYSKIRPYLRKVTIADFRGVCSADMYPLSITSSQIDREFLMWSLLSPQFTEYARSLSGRARIPKVNRNQLFAYQLRYPDIKIQRQLVNYLNTWRDEVKEMNKAQNANAELITQLEQSFLAQAFHGEM